MDGETILSYLRGLRAIRAQPNWANLEEPSDPGFNYGVLNSVTIQYRRIDAQYDHTNGLLTLSRNTQGNGYWIPYIGNGPLHIAGVAQMQRRGLGSFTWVPDHLEEISWVATGPFSGCYTASFNHPQGGKIFAHLITPAQGYTAASLPQQKADIENFYQTPGGPTPEQVLNNHGLGYVFWVKVENVWSRIVIFANMDGADVYFTEEERLM